MKILRGIGIFICVLVITFIMLFNINNVVYRTNNQRINFFGYKLMTIENKYDYYLVKDVSIDDVILYDNVSFRVNSTDYSRDAVKGKVNGCLKLTNNSTVVCSDNLEGKVVMKVSGARDLLLVNKGAIIVLVFCIILLIFVFLWKPKDLKKTKADNKEKDKKEKKENNVVEISTEPFKEEKKEDSVVEVNTEPFKEEVKEEEKVETPNEDQTVIIDTSPFREEIKTDVEVPQVEENQNNQVNEVNTFNVPNNLEMQNNIEMPQSMEIPNEIPEPVNVEVPQAEEVPTDGETPLVEGVPSELANEVVEFNEIEIPTEEQPNMDVPVENVETPLEDKFEIEMTPPVENVNVVAEESTIPQNVVVVPYDKLKEMSGEQQLVDKYSEVDSEPIFKEEKNDYFNNNINNDIFGEANINNSVEIDLNEVEVDDSVSEKIKVTPIYSSNQGFNDDVEIL